jgi:undecaprenyl diphosphate synthase
MQKINHIAAIMDGNRRWAKNKGLPVIAGHKKGADAARNFLDLCIANSIKHLTLYVFSTENWNRTKDEVAELMQLLDLYIKKFGDETQNKPIAVKHLGDISRLPEHTANSLQKLLDREIINPEITICLAINYGSRQELEMANGNPEKLYTSGIPDPDIILRTGGEKRLSNFLLYQAAYSELYFTDTLWPDFDKKAFDEMLADFYTRNRKFGA